MFKNLSFTRLSSLALGLLLPFLIFKNDAQSNPKSLMDNALKIDNVPSGHFVGFCLLSNGDMQYAAYYDAEHNMVVASRRLSSTQWTKQTLPSKTGWDSHNYITMAIDRDGRLHVSGNMHAEPLIYFRTEKPGDIATLRQYGKMTGRDELRATYPQFIKTPANELIFTYRDGSSGKGNTIYNRYDEKTKNWSRLIDQPLFDGQGKMNAYPNGPTLGPDGYWHMSWVWRNSPMCETNHDLSYVKSKDLIHWETAAGKPVALPISLNTEGVVVDPIPMNGGIINGSGKIGFDNKKQVVLSYHKFDQNGATQAYLTRFEDGKWNPRVLTKWSYRWEPKGPGSISFDVTQSPLQFDPKAGYYIGLNNAKHGSGIYKVDPETLQLGDKIADSELPGYLPPEITKLSATATSNMQVRFTRDIGKPADGKKYILRWETLPINRDRPPEGAVPPPSELQLVELP